jgi:hypothetical protein
MYFSYAIQKSFFKSNYQPRKWVKNIIFDADFQVKPHWRFVVFNSRKQVREIFFHWHSVVSNNPSPTLDPQWVEKRNTILLSKRFASTKK